MSSYEYIKEIKEFICPECGEKIKNLPIADELYSSSGAVLKYNFVTCPYCNAGMYLQGYKVEESHVIKQVFNVDVILDYFSFIEKVLKAKRKELTCAIDKVKNVREKERLKQELAYISKNIDKYIKEYSIVSDME